jgi:protein gp37
VAETTKISWADATFNPWIGCSKVSPGCTHCYAESEDNRRGWTEGGWGRDKPRRRTSDANWRGPLKWQREAVAAANRAAALKQTPPGRRRVFMASLADVFDREVDPQWRLEALALAAFCTQLDFLILTKRADALREFFADDANPRRVVEAGAGLLPRLVSGNKRPAALQAMRIAVRNWPPPNFWLGVSAENQEWYDRRIPELLTVEAAVRWVSYEPALGRIEFSDASRRPDAVRRLGRPALEGVDWVVCGGESGPQARPMYPDWARSVRDQCAACGVAFFFKQWGEYAPEPPQMRPDAMPVTEGMYRLGKKASGDVLDGRQWHEFPMPRPTPRWSEVALPTLGLVSAPPPSGLGGF